MEYNINTLRYYVNKREGEIKNYFKKQKKFVIGKTYSNCKILYRGIQGSYEFRRDIKNRLTKKYTLYYLVKSTSYPKESNYIITHNKIKSTGCLYKADEMKLAEEKLIKMDSLTTNPYSKHYVDKNNIDYYSKISIRANIGKLEFTCSYCSTNFKTDPRRLTEIGSTCPWCSNIMSYPERFMKAYLESKGLKYIQEYKIPKNDVYNSGYRIDFIVPELKIAIEMDGEQHFYTEEDFESETIIKNSEKYNQLLKSHEAKIKYCKENNLKLVRIDSRKSNYYYIAKNIEDSMLPNITEENKKYMAYFLSLYKGKELKIGTCCGYKTKNYEIKERNESNKIDNYNKNNLPIEKFMTECEFVKV